MTSVSLASLSLTRQKQAAIAGIRSLITPEEYAFLERKCEELYGLQLKYAPSYVYNVKSIMAREHFTFTEDLSESTKTFQLLHVIGHYHFMTQAFRRGIHRYDHIYSTFGNASLHIYEEPASDNGQPPAPIRPGSAIHVVPESIRVDRVLFETGANKYAMLLLDYLGMRHLEPLMKAYEPADILYLLDITAFGRRAILATDTDYLDHYVCNNPVVEEEADTEGVYDPASFRVSDIDWPALEALKLEFHFF
jgi:hypothetical protein